MPWFAKIEQGIVDKATFDKHVPAHKAYVQKLIEAGHLVRTGYWVAQRGGMMIFTATSIDQAQAIVAQDPLVEQGCVTYELHEWRIVLE